MTAREPANPQPHSAPADPLAKPSSAKTTPANTSPAAPAAAGADKTSAVSDPKAVVPEKKKSGGGLVIGIVAVLLLVVGGGAAAAFFLLSGGEPVQVVKAPPVPPDPGSPPAPPEFKFEEQAAGVKRNAAPEHTALVTTAVTRLQQRLFLGNGEVSAPREFVVRGGGVSDAAGLDLPNHERWEIQFPPGLTIEAYTRQLDFFKIELGVIGGSQQVTYLSSLSNPKPRVRTGPGNTETRMYLIWNRGPMREADEILAARAGLQIEGKVLAHFVPPELEAEMLRIEAAQARTNNLMHIRRTIFGIQSVGADSFRMFVAEQKGD
jgi:hypothetical protein